MLMFARDTNAALVSEGIETRGELDTLRELGVQYGQGLSARPACAALSVRPSQSMGARATIASMQPDFGRVSGTVHGSSAGLSVGQRALLVRRTVHHGAISQDPPLQAHVSTELGRRDEPTNHLHEYPQASCDELGWHPG